MLWLEPLAALLGVVSVALMVRQRPLAWPLGLVMVGDLIGLLGASAFVAAFGDGRQFASGRDCAAALGLVPRQHSTGGRSQLGGISKRGDAYLRTLFIHGARAVLRYADRHDDPRSRWIQAVKARRGIRVAAVALANKMARTAWAVLTRETPYQVPAAA